MTLADLKNQWRAWTVRTRRIVVAIGAVALVVLLILGAHDKSTSNPYGCETAWSNSAARSVGANHDAYIRSCEHDTERFLGGQQ